MSPDPTLAVVERLQRQLAALAGAAQDLDNAAVALREKNQDQVREILQRGARKLAQASADGREAGGQPPRGRPWLGRGVPAGQAPAGAMLPPMMVPAVEPADPRERGALEEQIRTRLQLLGEPYLQLVRQGAVTPDLQKLVRACRDAVNEGALRKAALDLNAAAELMQRLAGAGPTPPAPPPTDRGRRGA